MPTEPVPLAAHPAALPAVPQEAFFQLTIRLPRLRPLPRLDGGLQGWPPAARLPDLTGLHGQRSFATVYAGWSPEGLAFAFAVRRRPHRLATARRLHGDGVELWVDTRDSRTAKKLTRFCHHWRLVPTSPEVYVEQVAPAVAERAGAEGKAVPLRTALQTATDQHAPGYTLEVFIPAAHLAGYTPQELSHIGLCYRVRSEGEGLQDLSYGERFPLWRNPSLWISAELAE